MDKKSLMRDLIEQKKLRGSNRKPRYATRKLSIGLVSCMLGFTLLVSPTSVEASEVEPNEVVSEEGQKESADEANTEKTSASDETKENTEATPKEETPGQPEQKKEIKEDGQNETETPEQGQALKPETESQGKGNPTQEAGESKDSDTKKAQDAEAKEDEKANSNEENNQPAEEAKNEEVIEFTPEQKESLAKAGISEERIANLQKSYNALKDKYTLEVFIADSIKAEKNKKTPEEMTKEAKDGIATRAAAEPEESGVGNDARDAVHAFVGVQTGGDLNLELANATGQEFKPIEGVRGYFQWFEDGGYVSPIYTAVSDANGRLNIGAKPYLAADGKLIKFDADPTVSAGNERYRF